VSRWWQASCSQTRPPARDVRITTSCVLMMLFIGTAESLLAVADRNGDVKRWRPDCLGVAGKSFSISATTPPRVASQPWVRDWKAPATGAGFVGARKLSWTVSKCFKVLGDSGSAIEDAVALDDLESVAQDLTNGEAELLLRPNSNFALLLTELMVPDCEALLTGV
jgi:hypothetical protein